MTGWWVSSSSPTIGARKASEMVMLTCREARPALKLLGTDVAPRYIMRQQDLPRFSRGWFLPGRLSSGVKSLNHVSIEKYLCGRSIGMVFNDAKLRAGLDNFKEDLVVFRIFSPAPWFASPYDSIAFYPASISPDEIVDRTHIGQEQDVVGCACDLNAFGITARD